MPGQTLSPQTPPKSICILRLSAIGDVCHAVSMVQAIQRQYPESKITWVIGKIEQKLLEGLKGVEFVIFDKRAGLKGYRDLKQALNGRKFDVLLHMQIALRASLASWCIQAKVKIGFDSSRAKEGQWIFTNRKIQAQKHPHVLEGFQGFAQAIGVACEEPAWDMPLPREDQDWAVQTVQQKKYAVISPAASKAERNWNPQGYASAASYLEEKGYHVVLCGGPTEMERQLGRDISALYKGELTNLIGETSLKQLLAVLKNAALVISPDTGPAHMAVTVGTPVIGLYAHSNPRRTGPYLYQEYIVNAYDDLVQEQHGKPWDQLPWGVRVKGEGLMDRISVEKVQYAIDQLLTTLKV